jgi:hypothetical protein
MTSPVSNFFSPRGAAVLALALTLPALAACENESSAVMAAAPQAVANPCGSAGPTKTSALPKVPGNTQLQVDCEAWQAFIALNWRADPANPGQPDNSPWESFGTPGDTSLTVWESYHEAANVFGGQLKGKWQAKRPSIKRLARTSKFGSLDLTDIGQAGKGFHWLTNQRGDLTYYEVLMNQDEFEFVTENNFDLTTAAGQYLCATQKGQQLGDAGRPPPPDGPYRGGMNLPAGQAAAWDDTDCKGNKKGFGRGDGSIEIKAAWTPLPADRSLDYRYKTAIAQIQDPATKRMRQVTVGLVGLHIVRKRFPRLPWVWATFEHIDNSPDENRDARAGWSPPVLPPNPNQVKLAGFTYFNPSCNSKTDKAYGCAHNLAPTRPCIRGIDPYNCQPFRAPMQITRINRVAEPANSVTAYAWSLMPRKSVFNYYRLINVQFPQEGIGPPPKHPAPGTKVKWPLTMGRPIPSGAGGGTAPDVRQIVSNTTMESFQQKSNSCLDCHVYAPIASAPASPRPGVGGLRKQSRTAGQTPPFASDYSFIFSSETKR